MARPLRIEFPGAVYHVTSRGDRREPIFVDDVDRRALLDVLASGLERFDGCALAWCLMGNHYHFVLQTRQPNLSLLMRHINGVYTQRFNQRHRKVGHLFQGRFKAVLVDRDSYLLEVCRYVELNPVRAGMVAAPGDWPWSSCAALTGQAPCPPWLDRAAVWGYLVGEDAATHALAKKASLAYADLVAAGKDVSLWPDHLRQQMYLGDEAFVLRMQALASDRAVSNKEIPKVQRASPKTLQDWLALMPSRDEAIVAAHRHSQLSMSDIARDLGLSVSRVSRIIARAQDQTRAPSA
jgi:putative transposase